MADDLEDTIRDSARGPRSAKGDVGEIQQHSLADQIAADRYLASKKAAKNALGVKRTKMVPPGAD